MPAFLPWYIFSRKIVNNLDLNTFPRRLSGLLLDFTSPSHASGIEDVWGGPQTRFLL